MFKQAVCCSAFFLLVGCGSAPVDTGNGCEAVYWPQEQPAVTYNRVGPDGATRHILVPGVSAEAPALMNDC